MNNKIKIKVVGNNVNRFIIRLNQKKINIYHIDRRNKDYYYLIIDYNSFDDVIKYKTIYDIEIVEYIGPIKIKNDIIKNKYYLVILFMTFIGVFILTRLTFNIKVITNNKKLNKLILTELKEHGIYKYSFLKDYKTITKTKKDILAKYPDLFEWLEIKRKGTSYIIRFEERLENNINNDNIIYDIVVSKDCRLIDLDIESGQIVKNVNEYVKKGDIIVSSDIKLNDEIKSTISAKGKVYGEVWYNVSITIPKDYVSKKLSGKSVKTYSLNFFSFKILFNKSSFNDKIVISDYIIGNNLFDISFNKDEIKEVIIDKNINKEKLALNLGLDKIRNKLKDKEEIIDYFIVNKNNDTINIFVSVKERVDTLIAR